MEKQKTFDEKLHQPNRNYNLTYTAMEVSGGEVVVHEDGGSSDNITGSLAGNAASNQVVVDALPYIDLGYDEPGVREAVRKTNSNYIATTTYHMFTQNTRRIVA